MSHPLFVGMAIGCVIGVLAPIAGAYLGAVLHERNLQAST
jgi:hypothetical protein